MLPCRFSKGIEARGQLLHDIEQLVRAREAREKKQPTGNGNGGAAAAATRKNVFDYTLDQQREEVRQAYYIYSVVISFVF
jgi:hypothetical protein